MSFSVGIVGLPNVGKSTLFKALTQQEVKIESRPFTTIDPNIGRVLVPDERLTKIAKITNPKKITPTTIEFVDIAGLVRGAHKGEGLGNQFLAQIRNCDAIVEVIRAFENERVEHLEKGVDPKRDLEIIEIELLMKDLETVDKIINKLEKGKEKIKKISLLRKIKENLTKGKRGSILSLAEEENLLIKEFQFLTSKPIVYLFNIGESKIWKVNEKLKSKLDFPYLALNLKLEEEVSELSSTERKELKITSSLDQLILACYNALDIITFFTVTGEETKAWTIKKGTKAPEAGGKVHTDFEEKFIKAEVINWKELIETGSWKKAKELGLVKIVGKDYKLKDGNVIEFKI